MKRKSTPKIKDRRPDVFLAKPTSKKISPAAQAWMVQWRLFRDMVATF